MFSIYSMASESFGADFVVVAVAPLISSLCVLFSGLGGAEVSDAYFTDNIYDIICFILLKAIFFYSIIFYD